MSDHAILSPSGSDRWAVCLGSLAATKHIPNKSGSAAALGTCKHEDSERWLKYDALPVIGHLRECDGFKFVVDEEYIRHVEYYVNYVRQQPGEHHLEVRLNTSNVLGVAGQFGRSDDTTLDYAAKQITVIDAKFGYERVFARKRQLKIYGAAALEQFEVFGDWETLRLVIVQPALDWVDELVMTRAEVAAFVAEIRPAAMTAYGLWESGSADEIRRQLRPDPDACKYCPLSGNCPAEAEEKLNMFDTLPLAHPTTSDERLPVISLSNNELGTYRERVEEIETWCAAIRKEAHERAMKGEKVALHKLVKGKKGNRAWVSGMEDSVKSSLEIVLGAEDMYKQTLLSPTQVEAALKKAKAPGVYDAVKVFVHQPEGSLQLVHVSDPRPEASPPVQVTDFGVIA